MEIKDNDIIMSTLFGSHVYKTNTKESDIDIVCIVDISVYVKYKNIRFWNGYDCKFYLHKQFQIMLNNHEIMAMECYFYSEAFRNTFDFKLNKDDLRSEISRVSSNSWQKGYKKLVVTSDYDKYLALKSLFHSIRILDFGLQIGNHGKIVDFESMSYIYFDMMKYIYDYEGVDLWLLMKSKYEKIYKEKKYQFKKLCPKKTKFDLEFYLMNIISETKSLEDAFNRGRCNLANELLKKM